MWINHEKEFVFIAVPKCGSTSIAHSLGFTYFDNKPKIYHASINDVREFDNKTTHYFSFGFVRNPFDRLVSVFMNGHQDRGHLLEWGGGLESYDGNFERFVKDFPDSKWVSSTHFLPCSYFVTTDENVSVDFVGKYENLKSDFEMISERFNINSELGIHHKSQRDRDYRKYYDNEMIEIVSTYYADDLENFGYSYDGDYTNE
tara:strand:+ start:176 stop:781 length:606 start_codon:yes stop_codon:yes gene_type:complete